MATSTGIIKQIATGRRKPGLTRKEFFDHRFQIHGSISDAVDDKNQKPHKYIQTQIFDSAYGPRGEAGPLLNANQTWCGRDDTTELFFRDWDHVTACFNSDHVKKVIAPDGFEFADFETAISLMAREKELQVSTRLASKPTAQPDYATVAMYFVSTPDNQRNGHAVEAQITPLLITELEKHCQDEVWGIRANVAEVSEHFDLHAYFGGADLPPYAVVYKIYIKDEAYVPSIRKAQKDFEAAAKQQVDTCRSFIVFSKEALILDVEKDVKFSLDRQPVFADLPGPSHLKPAV
ncbi:hypothetical protein ACJQWK_03202 [Exserohilum turcicum]|uniref:EthD domain-containing protein n=1 Tax=Exserohilum turcicum (strain 28A) TaxID=671987 RepID=R0KVS6_EXST2|nr:uncharacterized protein SETTUDRAFT_152898 [Exserohilum turcica Et28A]EOA91862.1 hypothetical protein SETTUDRAFT_152898 [Exserohilum turcica Et28A]